MLDDSQLRLGRVKDGAAALDSIGGMTLLVRPVIWAEQAAAAITDLPSAIRNRIQRMLDPEALFQSKCVPDGEALPVVVEVGIDVVIAAPILDPLGPLLELVL